MAKVKLSEFAMARSGDKGDGSNVGVFVTNEADYEVIKRERTGEASHHQTSIRLEVGVDPRASEQYKREGDDEDQAAQTSELQPRDRRRGKLGSVILCSKPWHEKADEGASDDPQEPAVLNTHAPERPLQIIERRVQLLKPRPGQTQGLPLNAVRDPTPDRVGRLGLGRR